MKKIMLVALIVILALGVIGVVKDQAIGSIVGAVSSSVLGAPVKIGGLSIGILKQSIRIRDLRVYQPKGFPSGTLIDIPVIAVDYDLKALLGGKLHFPLIELNLKEMSVIKNKDKQLNIEALKVAPKKEEKTPAAKKEEKKPSKPLSMQIDVLKLNAGQIIYTDLAAGEKPVVQVYDAGIKNKTYQNITSAQELIALLFSESLKGTAIQGAKIYAANAILGAGFLPAGVALTLAGKDSDTLNIDKNFETSFGAALKTVANMGTLKSEDRIKGVIKADISKSDVTIKVEKVTEKTTRITVSARQMLLPKPEIAKGVSLDLSERLK